MDKPVLLEVKDLKTYFYSGKHALKAVDGVSSVSYTHLRAKLWPAKERS